MQFRGAGVLLVRALLVLRAQTSFFGPDVRTSGIYENPGWPADRIKRTQSYRALVGRKKVFFFSVPGGVDEL